MKQNCAIDTKLKKSLYYYNKPYTLLRQINRCVRINTADIQTHEPIYVAL